MYVARALFAGIASAMCVIGCGSHAPPDTDLASVDEDRALVKFHVNPTVETEPVPHDGDAADDPAIWIHPSDPAQSTIIGTDKRGGLAVCDLQGTQIQYVADGKMNNVDIRYNFPLGAERVALVTASNRTKGSIAIYAVEPSSRQLRDVSARSVETGLTVYGCCMYHSPVTGKYYFIVNDKNGVVQQWEVFDNGDAKVDAAMVRTFKLESQPEGCVADDELGQLYIGEEEKGIWKYSAEPEDDTERRLVDATHPPGHLAAQVEGLTLYYTSDRRGYLIASSQGSNQFTVYRREGKNNYVTTFEITGGKTVDGVTHTDGIDVTNFPLGPRFPAGVFIAQDHRNTDPSGAQNYKLIPWEAIATGASPPLMIDVMWDPRRVGDTR